MKRLFFIVIVLLMITGCTSSQKAQRWGEGDLPDDWKATFGDDNISRLNFAQTERINQQGQALAVIVDKIKDLEYVDPNVPTLEERIAALEDKQVIDVNELAIAVGKLNDVEWQKYADRMTEIEEQDKHIRTDQNGGGGE